MEKKSLNFGLAMLFAFCILPVVSLGTMVYTDTESAVLCTGNWATVNYVCSKTYDNDYCNFGGGDYSTYGRVDNVAGYTADVYTNYSNNLGVNRTGYIQTQDAGDGSPYNNYSVPLACVETSTVMIRHTSRWTPHDILIYCYNGTDWDLVGTNTNDESICEIGYWVNEVDDFDPPKYYNVSEPEPKGYDANNSYNFNSTWIDNIIMDTVKLTFNETEYESNVTDDIYYKVFVGLPSGDYNYSWWANDSFNLTNETATYSYTVATTTTTTIIADNTSYQICYDDYTLQITTARELCDGDGCEMLILSEFVNCEHGCVERQCRQSPIGQLVIVILFIVVIGIVIGWFLT